jgi:hydroxymethylbilane synthase
MQIEQEVQLHDGLDTEKRFMSRLIRIGSRGSALSIAQTRIIMDAIAQFHPEITLSLVTIKTLGDLRPDLPLEASAGNLQGRPSSAGKALFTGALEEALGRCEVDICVHSLKDMAWETPKDLPILAIPKRGDPRDCLILPQGERFSGFKSLGVSLPAGCSSLRRKIQLHALAPDLRFAPIRGNVPTRITKLEDRRYGALVLAAAGLERLGISSRAAYVFPVREMIPAAGQGVLAVQGRLGEDFSFLDTLRDPVTASEALAERRFIQAAGGGCGSAAAAYARISGGEINLIALYARDAEAPFFRDEISGPAERGESLAEKLARRLLQKAGL